MSIVLIIFVFVIIGITIYNEAHRSKYNKLMLYLEQNHPGIYEEIRIKPVFGPFYAKNTFKKSIDYAKNHQPLSDPIAEELLKDYAEFSQKGVWLIGAIGLISLVVLLGWMLFLAIY